MKYFIKQTFAKIVYRFFVLIFNWAERAKNWSYDRYKLIVPAACSLVLLFGCSTTLPQQFIDWAENNPELIQELFDDGVKRLEDYFANKSEPEKEAEIEQAEREDEFPFAELNWTYGHFDGSKSKRDVRFLISDLKMTPTREYHTYAKGSFETLWGASDATDASRGLSCIFFRNNAGKMVGGKFDWISTSRSFRDLKHCYDYNGWTMDDIPNNTDVVFVIVHPTGGVRTNTLLGKWSR